ncbi:MAG: aminotransferase class IV [Saprospiraceae bacterium]
MEFHFFKNKIVHQSEAQISVFDLAIARGYGVFDYFKVLEGVPVFMDDHITRFKRSSEKLHLQLPLSANQIKEIIFALIEKNQMENGAFKLILTGGISSNGFDLDGSPTLIILANPLNFKVYHSFENIKLLNLKTLDYVRETPGIKSINYMVAMMNWHQLSDGKYDDFLYVKNNVVSETSRANIFIINEQNKLITPIENILEGITRKQILAIGQKLTVVEQREITLEETLAAKEVFLTSTTKQAMPVVNIDGKLINNGVPGMLTKQIFDSFHQLETKYIEDHKKLMV